MLLKDNFIKATERFCTIESAVPAYYFRRGYVSDSKKAVKLRISACGFYELYFNGERITKGLLSPYISNTDDLIYYDEYDVTLSPGENVFGVLLGNGFQNNPGGYIWDFDKASFRSAPMFALTLSEGENVLLRSDESFKTFESPIRRDDYRFGEYYDANYEIVGWNKPEFRDTGWKKALLATPPLGEMRLAEVAPIVKEREIAPVDIIKCDDGGYIYDFGECGAGICRLCIRGEPGQKVELRHADALLDGDIDLRPVWFVRDFWERDRHIVHLDTYVCRGEGVEIYEPTFTYHGFRYVKVNGIKAEQATYELLTCLVYHTRLESRGDFRCSDPVANKLQEMTRRSILSNFHHFPTDCPQREKNGWTADAALTAETAILNFDPELNYREWLRNICKAQNGDGAIPGIVPTGGWGFHWGNGPAWDSVLAYLPYYVYIYRGDTEMIKDSRDNFLKYLRYLERRRDDNGLLSIGLGDWCHVGGIAPKAPLVLTDTLMAMDIAGKIGSMLDVIGMTDGAKYARGEAAKYRKAIRDNLIYFDEMTAIGDCQSSQAMSLYYDVFDEAEESLAFERLLEMIRAADDHMDVGVLGGRVLFHVLSRFGKSDLAYKMITREDYPSFGNWIARGATTLWEGFMPEEDDSLKSTSLNHHFWGDISAWFIKSVAGINLNPSGHNLSELRISPSFIQCLDHVEAYHVSPMGRISVSWRKEGEKVAFDLEIPEGMDATLTLDKGFAFADGSSERKIVSGGYVAYKKKGE